MDIIEKDFNLNISNYIDKSSEMDVLEGYLDSDKTYSIKIPVTNNIFSINIIKGV